MENVYYVQCISGNPDHVKEVVPGTELEKTCKARTALDAFCLNVNECPDCIEETREREKANANMCGDVGCPFIPSDDESDPCATGCCFAREYRAIKDSRFADQLRDITPENSTV